MHISKFLHKNNVTSCYHIGTNQLTQSNLHRDLGVLQSTNLSWSHHYNHISANAYKSLGLLRRTFSSYHSTVTLYISLVRSKLIYSSQLWNPYLIKDIVMLERIQRHATKFILNDYTSSYKSRLLKLNILPLMYQFDYYDTLFFLSNILNIPLTVSIFLITCLSVIVLQDRHFIINFNTSTLLAIFSATHISAVCQKSGTLFHLLT